MNSSTLSFNGASQVFIHLILFLLFGAILFCVTGIVGEKIYPVSQTKLANSANVAQQPLDNIKIVTLGPSHNIAIDAEQFNGSLLELWSNSQKLDESEFLLEFFKDRLPQGTTILFPVSVGTLKQRSFLSHRVLSEIVAAAPLDTLLQSFPYNINIYAQSWHNKVARSDNWLNPIKKLVGLQVTTFKRTKPKNYDPFARNIAIRHMNRELSEESNPIERNFNRLKKVLSIGNEMGSCFIFYEAPVSDHYLEVFRKKAPKLNEWKNTFRSFIKNHQQQYCMIFLESIWPSDYTKQKDYYMDQVHLNDKGSKHFTLMLRKRIADATPINKIALMTQNNSPTEQ